MDARRHPALRLALLLAVLLVPSGARIWRQVWSNHLLKDRPAREVHAMARETYASANAEAAA